MNIWVLNHYATPPDLPGGTRHFDLARELVKQGHKVTLLSSAFVHTTRRNERLKPVQLHRWETVDGVEFLWVRTLPYHGGHDWRRVANMLSYGVAACFYGMQVKPRPTVVLASSPHPFAAIAGYVLARARRSRFVLEIRDLWPQAFVDIGGYSDRSLVVRLAKLTEKFLYRRARRVVIVAPGLSDYIVPFGVSKDRIVCVPNGVNPDLFAANSGSLPQEIGKDISGLRSQGKTIAGYTGSHGTADALDTVLGAAQVLQEKNADSVHFVLVGSGPEKERLVQKAASQRLTNISFHPPVPKHSMPALLEAIDIAVLPKRRIDVHRYGTSFLKLWDYMMSGRPIIFGAASANDPVAEARCGLTVPPEEPDRLADAVLAMCNMSGSERQEMGERGRQYVVKYHSTPVLAARLLMALQEVSIE